MIDFRYQNENLDATNQVYSYSSLRFPKTSPDTMEEQVEMIANHLDRKIKFRQNNPATKTIKLEMLKNMPQSLTLKRAVKAKLEISVEQKLKNRTIGFCKKMKYQLSITASKVKEVYLKNIRLRI